MVRFAIHKAAYRQQLRKPVLGKVHLLPGVLRKHLPIVRDKESSEDFRPVLLCGLWLRRPLELRDSLAVLGDIAVYPGDVLLFLAL